MKKRILSVLLVLCMVLTLLPVSAQALPTANVWDGTSVETDWYTSNKSASTYVISTGSQLAGLAQLVNNDTELFAGKTIILENDIDLDNQLWIPIGTKSTMYQFRGDFNGNNHTIQNLYVNVTDDRAGLFGALSRGTIQNLNVTGTVRSSHSTSETMVYPTGGIAGSATDTNAIQNCSFTGNVTGYSSVGGIVGTNKGIVQNCSHSGPVITELQTGGGIAGYNTGTIELCSNTGAISTTGGASAGGSIGGVVGESCGRIIQCYNTGSVTGTHSTGGLVGSAW